MPDPQRSVDLSQEPDVTDQLRRLIRAAKANRFGILICAAIGMIIGGFIGAIVPNIYESRTLLLLRERALIDDSRLLKAIEDKPLSQKEDTLEQELKSYGWVVDVLKEVEWMEFAEARSEPAKIKELVDKVRDPDHFDVQVNTDPAGELLVDLTFRWYDAQQAHDFVRAARKNWIRRRDEESKAYWRMKLLQGEGIVTKREKNYEQKAASRENFMREHGLSFSTDLNTDANLKNALMLHRQELVSRIKESETRLRGLQEQLETEEKILSTRTQEPNPEYQMASQRLSAERSILDSLLQKKTDSHPDVKKQRAKVEEAEAAFARVKDNPFTPTNVTEQINEAWTELRKAIDLGAPSLAGLREQLVEVNAQLRQVDSRLEALPGLTNQLDKLNNEYNVSQEELNQALIDIAPLRDKVHLLESRGIGLFSDSEEALRLAGAFEILEEPVVPVDTIGIPKQLYSLVGLLTGLAIGLVFSLAREVTRASFYLGTEVQLALALPVLGSVGHIATAGEVRERRNREILRMSGSLLFVCSLAVFAFIMTTYPEILPSGIQNALNALRTALR